MGTKKKTSNRQKRIRSGINNIWQYSRQVFAVSSVNGISHIALAPTNGKRILWITLFTCGVLGWFYQTTALLEYYYRYPTVVKIDVEKPAVIDFPALTICNVNRIRRSKFCEEFPERCGTKKKDIVLSEEEIFNLTFEFMKRGKKDQLGHQINDMIVSCEFSGHPKLKTRTCMEYFTYLYDPHLGNCYAFSSGGGLRPRLHVTEPDAWQEIKDMDLVLNVEHDEYLDYNGVTPGLIIAMHEDMAYPQLYAHGVHVYADHSYNLAVSKVSVHLLPQPYKSNCTDYKKLPFHSLSNMELTPRICTVECVMYHQRRTCQHSYVTDNVVLFSEEMPYDPDKITQGDKQCAISLSEDYKEYCRSLCSVPCHDVHYPVSIDSSPTSEHKVVIKDEDLKAYKERTRKDKGVFASDVRIHYQTMEHRIYRHSPEFTTETLFSYLGGITGGWLGISLLEFCAFLEGVFSVLIFSFTSCSKPKKKKKKTSPVSKVSSVCRKPEKLEGILLGLPIVRSGKTIRVVPYQYY